MQSIDDISTQQLTESDRCLLRNSALLSLTKPDAAGFLYRRSSSLSGWYQYWFTLHGSQLRYFSPGQSGRRGLLSGTISLFRHTLTIITIPKRRREFEILDNYGKQHILRADTDVELHWWVKVMSEARNKIPPAQPIDKSFSPAPTPTSTKSMNTSNETTLPPTIVDTHLRVDHLLCIVHGIGAKEDVLSGNIRQLQESYTEVMNQAFPDVNFRVELLVVQWHASLLSLDIHNKLQAVLPRAPVCDEDANPLRQIMVHRIVDYVYYTHARYRKFILRDVAAQLNKQVKEFYSRRPDFAGKISVMGHSLGAALCYELMCRKVHDDQVMLAAEGMRLEFDADNLFCLGSPLGILLGLDPAIGLGCDMTKLPFRMFNVFKYHDPVATRLEPCIDISKAGILPISVPCWTNMGVRESTAEWLGTLWAGQKNQNEMKKDKFDLEVDKDKLKSPSGSKDTSPHPPSSPVSGYITPPTLQTEEMRSRIDFVLQVTSTLEEVSTTWGAFCSHTEYWGNRDTMLLMLSAMMKSSFSIDDDFDKEIDVEIQKKIIDKDIVRKNVETGKDEDEELVLRFVVKSVVEEVIAKAVAKTVEALDSSKQVVEVESKSQSASWAAYLTPGWFRETKTVSGSKDK